MKNKTMKINKDNVEKIKMLADRLTYTVQSVEKIARISQDYDDGQHAFDMYNEDMNQLYSEISGDIIAVINTNSREYSNILDTKAEKDIDLDRIKGLTKSEKNCIDYACIDLDEENWLNVWYTDTPTQKKCDTIRKKILASINIEEVQARGYCQGDWDKYVIASYKKTITEDFSYYYDIFIKNLEYLFIVTKYNIHLVHKETRLYSSGIVEVEEVEQESYGELSYSGYIGKSTKNELIVKGYTIVEEYI